MRGKKQKEAEEADEVNHSLKKIVGAAGIVFLGTIFGKLIGYLYTMVAARLGSENYGMLSLAISILSFFTILSFLGLEQAVIRYIPYFDARKDKAHMHGVLFFSMKVGLIVTLFFTLTLFFFADKIAILFFHNPKLAPILKIFSLGILPISFLNFFASVFNSFQRVYYSIGIKEVLEKVVRIALLFPLVYLGFGVLGASISYVVSPAIMLFLCAYLMQKKVFPIFKRNLKIKYCNKELIGYSLPLILSIMINSVIASAGILLLGFFKTASEVGVFNAVLPTASLVLTFPIALTILFIPIVTKMYSIKKFGQLKRIYNIVCKWIFLINFPLFLLMVFFSKQIIRILFGEEYIIGAFALSILAFGYLLFSLFFINSHMLQVIKKTRAIFVISAVFAITYIALNLLLIPPYGVNGAAFAVLISHLVGNPLAFFFVYKYTSLKPFNLSYIKPLISAIVSVLVVYFIANAVFQTVSLYGLLLLFAIFLLLYVGLLFLFRSFEKEDIEISKLIFKKFKFPLIYKENVV